MVFPTTPVPTWGPSMGWQRKPWHGTAAEKKQCKHESAFDFGLPDAAWSLNRYDDDISQGSIARPFDLGMTQALCIFVWNLTSSAVRGDASRSNPSSPGFPQRFQQQRLQNKFAQVDHITVAPGVAHRRGDDLRLAVSTIAVHADAFSVPRGVRPPLVARLCINAMPRARRMGQGAGSKGAALHRGGRRFAGGLPTRRHR